MQYATSNIQRLWKLARILPQTSCSLTIGVVRERTHFEVIGWHVHGGVGLQRSCDLVWRRLLSNLDYAPRCPNPGPKKKPRTQQSSNADFEFLYVLAYPLDFIENRYAIFTFFLSIIFCDVSITEYFLICKK